MSNGCDKNDNGDDDDDLLKKQYIQMVMQCNDGRKKKEWMGTLNVADEAGGLEVVGTSSRLMQGTARRVARACAGGRAIGKLSPRIWEKERHALGLVPTCSVLCCLWRCLMRCHAVVMKRLGSDVA
jgi:hypothetical protein